MNPKGVHDQSKEAHPHREKARGAAGAQCMTSYNRFDDACPDQPPPLTGEEIVQLRMLLQKHAQAEGDTGAGSFQIPTSPSVDSEYSEFRESSHAWAVYADHEKKRAGIADRIVGAIIIIFQIFAYRLFAVEAIEDYQQGQVLVTVGHRECIEANGIPDDQRNDLNCVADFTNLLDAFVAFFMLAIFLAGGVLQAARSMRRAPGRWGVFFACLAAFEVVCAFLAASIAVSYNLFIGEVTDAVEVGVGLLFIRELSQQTYRGLRNGKSKEYRNFGCVITALVGLGLLMDPLCAKIFAGYVQ